MKKYKLLFVCHGNICRSTMAEFVMKDLVRKAGLADQFQIDSAACRRDEIGSDTHWGTKEKLREMNIPFTPRHARQITAEDYQAYDKIIGMDQENMRDLRRLTHGDPLHKTCLLLDFAGEHREVADPWYTGNFDATYNDVLKGCQALLRTLSPADDK
ncbi:low molecular weight protein-tyrosine-phosphatase [Mitsuokella sp.]|uniref:low molecular weight protein-tyrosine-phosphatase n=1 Tax=unclassified Mitsuokella TaxID=2637239 RepID=UPI003D7ED605